ncbi:hypothetical protein GOBAR_AA27059 [Gossypium barbadense]|uniref:Tim44-like domain-containing protein n=1 Tax=Gossypium barbadense TaxID=3634 RepID=A0A2P5WRF8_GOSBA|nr:hypothetical protein GOBAR_AA27059 [Gossypium barbadense]
MASRKLVRDFLIARQPLFQRLTSQQGSNVRLRLLSGKGYSRNRQFSVFNEFSKKIKGEANRNQDFKQSVEELKGKAEELKVSIVRVNRLRHTLVCQGDWPDMVKWRMQNEADNRAALQTDTMEASILGVGFHFAPSTKKLGKFVFVSANVKEKISAAKEEVKGTFGIGKEEFSQSDTSAQQGADAKDEGTTSSKEQNDQQPGTSDATETVFGKFKSRMSSPKVSSAFQKLKEAKVVDLAKKGYDIVKDELSGNPSKRKHLEYTPPPSSTGERSTRTDIVVLPSKQSPWSKKWEAFKEKMQGHPLFKRVSGMSEPVVTKGQEIAEDMRERWETSDNPIVHKIQESFSLPEFVAEVQEAIRPVLNAYIKGDVETLKKYCSPEVIDRCKAEHIAYQSHGIFFDNKILHISDVEVRETKMMGTSPIIIVAFQTQQIYCVRNREGKITEGGKDTIHTVYYAWAMQQVDVEELGEGALYPIWKLREMQQIGIQALI